MRGGLRQLLVGAFVVACGVAGAMTRGDDFASYGGTADLEARIAALEAEVAGQRARTQADTISYLPEPGVDGAGCTNCGPGGCSGGGCCDRGCGWVGRDFCNTDCRSCGCYGGAEIMFLKPFGTAFDAAILTAAGNDQFLPAWRLWGGYVNGDGLGTRLRWWQYDQSSFNPNTGNQFIFGEPSTVSSRLVFQKLDWEATQQLNFRRWELLVSGGLTYVGNTSNWQAASIANPNDNFAALNRFDGFGLTAGATAFRDMPLFPALALVGSVQLSGVYGNSRYAFIPNNQNLFAVPTSNATAGILELRLGPQYERAIGNGAIWFLSGAFEAQYWAGVGGIGAFEGGTGTGLGLAGMSVGTGIRR